jgi:hypothetical protein
MLMTDSGLQNYLSMITSIIAIMISSLTLGWTIYRDAIRKPKLRVDIAVKKLIQKDRQPEGPYVFIEALNLGPIPNRVSLTFARKSWIYRRILDRSHGIAMIYPDFGHWAATKASTRLEVGDTANFVFPYNVDTFLNANFSQVGVSDGFGRMHWSTRRSVRAARRRYQRDFLRDQSKEAAVTGNGGNDAVVSAPSEDRQKYYHSYKG